MKEFERYLKALIEAYGTTEGKPLNLDDETVLKIGKKLRYLIADETVEEEIPKDLEEAANHYASVTDPEAHGIDFIREVFIAGAEWQAGQLLKSSPIPEHTVLFNKGVGEGKKAMEEQMMKEVLECETVCIKDRLLAVLPIKEFQWTAGDKIKIIIVKVQDDKYADSMTANEELNEYASRAGFDYVDDIVQENPGHRFNDHDVEFAYRDGIIAGAEWQAEQLLKSSPLPEDTVIWDDGFKTGREVGARDMKERMMKDGNVILAEEDFVAEKEKSTEWGYNLCKEHMMNEAVEGTYNNSDWGTPCIDLPSHLELERFDKVKIIIVKENE